MKRNYFSILFFIKKTKLLKNGEAPVCLRITVNGKRAEVQIKRSVDIKKWNSRKECSSGRERKDLELNHYLETVRSQVLQIHRGLEVDGRVITAEIIKNLFYGKGEAPKMLLVIFDEHNRKCRQLLDKEYVLGTVLRYERTVKYLSEFLYLKYRVSDIPLREINNDFISGFEHFIKTEKGCAQNATILSYLLFSPDCHPIQMASRYPSKYIRWIFISGVYIYGCSISRIGNNFTDNIA